MDRLAILAGRGVLPRIIAGEHSDALFVHFEGIPVEMPANERLRASFEKIGGLFANLREAQVTDIVFAGCLERPVLDSARFDSRMLELAPRIFPALRSGDDDLLRTIAGIFEEEGFSVRGAHEVVSGLTVERGLLVGPFPSGSDRKDAERGFAIVAALGAMDVGQAAVVADGQALGVETLQGTDAMLEFVAETSPRLRRSASGVLVKAPKPRQDLRFDMPAIGPVTVKAAAKAGLAGIFVESERVLLLDRAETLRVAAEADIFIFAEKF